ncbi:hypothetical protein THAOC_05389, partial [Thalassiosira oceanica]
MNAPVSSPQYISVYSLDVEVLQRRTGSPIDVISNNPCLAVALIFSACRSLAARGRKRAARGTRGERASSAPEERKIHGAKSHRDREIPE